jgi:hypothetical protein
MSIVGRTALLGFKQQARRQVEDFRAGQRCPRKRLENMNFLHGRSCSSKSPARIFPAGRNSSVLISR